MLPKGRKKGRDRGGVCISFTRRLLETPPLPLPLKGGERLHIVFGLFFSGEGFLECTHTCFCWLYFVLFGFLKDRSAVDNTGNESYNSPRGEEHRHSSGADNHFSKFIITYKFRLAAAAAIIGGVRCHHWQRPLPIMSPPAANLKSMHFFPLRCLPFPVCRAPPPLKAPHFARQQQCSPACHHFSNCYGRKASHSIISLQVYILPSPLGEGPGVRLLAAPKVLSLFARLFVPLAAGRKYFRSGKRKKNRFFFRFSLAYSYLCKVIKYYT